MTSHLIAPIMVRSLSSVDLYKYSSRNCSLASSFLSLSLSLFIPPIFHKSYRSLSARMVSLWGAKRGDSDRSQSQEHNDNDDDEQNQTHHQEPTEQTRLLPRDDSNNFLSPDDPAVCTALQKC